MKTLYTIFFTITIASIFSLNAYSQGCVAIRSTGGSCSMSEHLMDSTYSEGSWIFSANHRYFKAFRHFRSNEQEKERLILGNEVINHQYSLDLVLTRIINNRWSFMIDVPILANGRSSLYEHGFTERASTSSYGLGDIRMAAYRWLLDPQKHKKGNIQFGLGIKLPTGDYKYEDFYQNVGPDGGEALRTVDQSIQLGDGGTGISAELNTFYKFGRNVGMYGNFFYLSNPREHNGVRTFRETIRETLANEAIMSVPDQYMARVGFSFPYKTFVASAGARLEGIPVYDLIGGSRGFRRPGYIWSAEPGFTYQHKKLQFFATVPIAFIRVRTQSVTDKENSQRLGTHVNGDAAFADYTINIGLSVKL